MYGSYPQNHPGMTKSNSPYGQIPPQLPPKQTYGVPMMGQPVYTQSPYQTQPTPYGQPQFQTQQPPYQTQQPPYRTQQPQFQTQQPQFQTQQPLYQLQPVNNNAWYGGYAQQLHPQELDQLRQWFARVDADRSGSIDANELQQGFFHIHATFLSYSVTF